MNNVPLYCLTKGKGNVFSTSLTPVFWSYGICWLHHCRGVRPRLHSYSGYDTMPFDGDAPVVKFWRMWSCICSLPLLSGSLRPIVVVPVGVPTMMKYLLSWKPFNCVQIKLLVFDGNTCYNFTVCQQRRSGLFKNCYLQTIH